MKKLDQKGLTGPIEIGLIAVAVIVVGFVAYRIGNARDDSSSASNVSNSSDTEAAELALKEAEENAADEVEVPAEEEKKDEVETATSEPVKKVSTEEPKDDEDEEEKEEDKKEYTYINFTKGGGGQSGEAVNVSAKLESAQTGTCYLKLYKDGQDKILKTKSLNNEQTCDASFPVSDIPVAGEWEVHVWFEGSDGITKANQDSYTIEVTK